LERHSSPLGPLPGAPADGLYKVEGAGNDFVLGLGRWADRLAEDTELVASLCDRRRGIGADGTVAVWAEGPRRARLLYRNANGGQARFCANATRCAARAATELLGMPPDLVVATDWAEILATTDGDEVSLELPPPSRFARHGLALGERQWSGALIEIGVPHLVLEARDLTAIDLAGVGPLLRGHPSLGPGGANVNLWRRDAGDLTIRTFERGVEAETLCCGSGLVAVALVVMADDGTASQRCRPASGDTLVVEALGTPPECPSRLCGPTAIVAELSPRLSWLERRR
jgi:diaminopimelate epimerase